MSSKLDLFNKAQLKNIPDIRPGDVVRVHLRLPEKTKRGGEKIQVFEGLVIARKHGKGINATFTIRKISEGIGVERIFPLHCPSITKIELVKRSKVRRAKLYYMRQREGKKARMKTKELLGVEWEPEDELKEKTEASTKEEVEEVKEEAEKREIEEKPEKESKKEIEKKEEKKQEESPKEETKREKPEEGSEDKKD